MPSKHSVLQSVSVVLDANVNSASSVLQLFDSVRGTCPSAYAASRLRRDRLRSVQDARKKNGQPTGLA